MRGDTTGPMEQPDSLTEREIDRLGGKDVLDTDRDASDAGEALGLTEEEVLAQELEPVDLSD